MKTRKKVDCKKQSRTIIASAMILANLLSLAAPKAFAREGEKGNGGGAHVCRGSDGSIVSVESYDLYEGRKLLKLKYPSQSAETTTFRELNRALGRMKAQTPRLYWRVAKVLKEMRQNMVETNNVDQFPVIQDANVLFVDKGCRYEQAAVWSGQYDRVFFNGEILSALKSRPLQLAGILLHEAVYAVGRTLGSSGTSDNARIATASAFGDREILLKGEFESLKGQVALADPESIASIRARFELPELSDEIRNGLEDGPSKFRIIGLAPITVNRLKNRIGLDFRVETSIVDVQNRNGKNQMVVPLVPMKQGDHEVSIDLRQSLTYDGIRALETADEILMDGNGSSTVAYLGAVPPQDSALSSGSIFTGLFGGTTPGEAMKMLWDQIGPNGDVVRFSIEMTGSNGQAIESARQEFAGVQRSNSLYGQSEYSEGESTNVYTGASSTYSVATGRSFLWMTVVVRPVSAPAAVVRPASMQDLTENELPLEF